MWKFTWRIENFSQLDVGCLHSLIFVVNGNKWRLRLYPKGRYADGRLSLYLCVPNSYRLPAEWSIPTKYSLSVVNQKDPNKTIKLGCEYTFKSGDIARGCTSFVELRKFHDNSGGYLVEDTCLIEAEVYVSPASTAKEDSDSSISIDPIECMYIEAQSFLESLPKPPCSSAWEMPLFIKRYAPFAKQILDKLMSYLLNDSADPKRESATMECLSTLTDHLYLLKATFFPQRVQEWRGSVQVKKDASGHPWSTFEKTKSLLQESVNIEAGIKIELEELNRKEMKFEAQMEAIESNSRQLKEEREEISKQMKIVCSLAKDKGVKIEVEKGEANRANQQLEQRLKSEWAAMRHLFAPERRNGFLNNAQFPMHHSL